jgi:DNA invertase Pin-like site-specific DNA recombinase
MPSTPTRTAAIYARVSTGEQSVEMQLNELIRFCEARGWQIRRYFDAGISGAKEHRPRLDQLWTDARSRAIDVVVVYRFDRFARSTCQLVNALHEFDSLGIQFVSLHENVGTTTPNGRLVFTIFAAIAEFERELIRQRVKSGLAAARARGQRLGRPPVFVPKARIDQLRAEGQSWRAIAKDLGLGMGTIYRVAQRRSKICAAPSGKRVRRCCMGKPATLFLVPPRQSPQLRCLNEKISRLAGSKPYGDFYHVFSLAARLAGDALEATQELQLMPGIDIRAFDPASAFWHRVRDYSAAAALNCVGGDQTLAEALVTYRLLMSIGE